MVVGRHKRPHFVVELIDSYPLEGLIPAQQEIGGRLIMSAARKLLLSSVVCAACAVVLMAGASTVLASDLPTRKGPPPAPAPLPYSWTGFNVGAQAGYGWGDEHDNLSVTRFGVEEDHFSANSAIGGAHVGYDQQFGSLVVGVRGEIDASGLRGSTTGINIYPIDPATGTCLHQCTVTSATLSFRNTWQAFLLGRAGVAFDRLLVYAVGGLAIADDRETVMATEAGYYTYPGTVAGTPTVWSGQQTKTVYGGALGLGAEYALDAHWRFGAEWRYARFDTGDYSATSARGFPKMVGFKAGFSENLALVDLSYRF
jgi:outer membrane immunogenic protein